jgi:hypothetical protein
MKKFIVLAILLAAGMSVYSQTTRTARETKNEKSGVKKESVHQSRKQAATETRKQATTQSQKQAATETGKQAATQSQKQAATETGKQAATQSRKKAATETGKQAAIQSRSQNTKATGAVRSGVVQRRVTTSNDKTVRTEPQKSSARIERPAAPAEIRMKNPSANRVFHESRGTLTRDDGSVVRHQNDEVFTRNRYNINYDNYETLRRSEDFTREYHNYNNWYDSRMVRPVSYYPGYHPYSMEYRRERYAYRQPAHYYLIWTPLLFNRFMYYYPDYTDWDIDYGREIETIPAYDVRDYIGTVRRVYGKVEEVYYSREDQNYILYIGDRFPYQDLSVVIPRNVAREITGTPEWYFNHEYVWLVGLIDIWEGKPEIIIRDEEQIRKY